MADIAIPGANRNPDFLQIERRGPAPFDGGLGRLIRVVQEALTNIMRHARSSRVHVNLIANEKEVRISIEDNGIGMPQRHLKGPKSLGIIGMKERMFQIGGEFNCSSEIGKGTRLEIKVPVGQ